MTIFKIIDIFNLVLAQTKQQKEETFISVALLALVASIFIMDIFAKNKFGAGKTLKKIIIFFCIVIIFIVIALFIFYR